MRTRRATDPICPVCGMPVDLEKAAGTAEYCGATYYFCSHRCKEKFQAQPGRYATEPR
ncbi:MAG: YHS domain-containing protein [Gemmatimonadetes bacterium]|nr:YHS domain-containing protein [Gemmatimonadota bacterium]